MLIEASLTKLNRSIESRVMREVVTDNEEREINDGNYF